MGEALPGKVIDISPRLIAECATGMEDWVDIARRYGFTDEEWAKVETRPEIVAAVEQKKHELYESGKTFQNRAKLMAEDAIKEVYKSMLRDSTPVKDKVAALLALSKLAGLDTVAQAAAVGSGFSITINLPTQTLKVAQAVVEEPKELPVEPEKAEVHLEFKK